MDYVRVGLEILGAVALIIGGPKLLVAKKITDVLIDAIEEYGASDTKKAAATAAKAEGVEKTLDYAVQKRTRRVNGRR